MNKWLLGWCLIIAPISIVYGRTAKQLFDTSSSDDFVIRWGFQKACDHVFDPRTNIYVWPTSAKGVTFNPAKVQPGDCIFVRKVDLFFKELHPHITHPYILVTHGEHLEAVKEYQLAYLNDPLVIAWFGIHPCEKTHPKYTPIPLGILQDPRYYKKKDYLHALFTELRESTQKQHLVYMNFADEQKPERKKLKQQLVGKPYCKRGARQPFIQYLKEMAECTFTLAPGGLGPDSYRVWEALLVGSIPIIRSSSIDPLLKGLPVLVVSKWSDITEEFLQQKYQEITSKKYSIKRLYMEYWLEKIQRLKSRFLDYRHKKETDDYSNIS
ncbi:hypothetical protein H0W26_00510 [Candidatus Dependentiae bacterium]|nr:hypothetical protein [Candidatus Dependentiae bacterium]